ncbi:CocE/NonD family hydrolase [Paractinoplanes rishiriensis]|uniref:Hydrolase n=1 Tax=Paractinoplanes rishiriensis TaxID=1050105 RepID=A0A919JUL3_9ACTN|nr:CocE/NonD family hydrolase [Actinoplanes rishiriensis]GIE93940.1 hydrolase [Actinoplanes rishiriensis]
MPMSTRQRLTDTALSRLLRLPPARNGYAVTPVRTPMRDGTVLVGDHFAPRTSEPRGTVLVRTPYGRSFPVTATNARIFAARGYHVVLQSVRGTFGSGGTFRPMVQEVEDGPDTVAWLREQPWFDGRLATLGASYLGWTQWSALLDPPPELRTAIVYVAPHDFREAVYGTGAFTLGDFLGWSDMIAHQEDGNLRRVLSMATANRRLRPALAGLPLPEAAETVLRGRAPWYREWVAHHDADDPWWQPLRAGAALGRVTAPVLVMSGWQDLFLGQSLEQYEALAARGVDVALTVGPWTHLEMGTRAAARVSGETLAWLDQHMAGGPAARSHPVRVHRTGEGRWHDLAAWPPPTTPATFRLTPDRALTLTGPAEPGTVSFRYDPADPTPALGGRTLTGSMGIQDNRALESRPDVVTFTTDPLPTAVDVAGTPLLDLAIAVDPAHADVFVRLCDVDERGRSRNFSDHLHRLDPAVPAGEVQHLTLRMDDCFHRLLAGHRLRLQVSGGAFPRYARNLGMPGTPAEGHLLRPSVHTVHCPDSRLTLPVLDASSTIR